MNRTISITLAIVFGIITGATVAPLLAQQESTDSNQANCFVGQGSNAACSGKWIIFAGNTSGVDGGAWIVRVNGETGEMWYKNGKKMLFLREPD